MIDLPSATDLGVSTAGLLVLAYLVHQVRGLATQMREHAKITERLIRRLNHHFGSIGEPPINGG